MGLGYNGARLPAITFTMRVSVPNNLSSGRAVVLAIALTAGLAACVKSPVRPDGSITLISPTPLQPANGIQIPYGSQPVTLTVANGSAVDPNEVLDYLFEVATDTNFTNKVAIKNAAQGAGQTSTTLSTLPGGSTYYWRTRVSADGSTGSFTPGLSFSIGPAVIINAPVVLAPAAGANVATNRPTLTVTNVTRSGPVGTMVYRFEISTLPTFATIALTGTVTEGTAVTSFTPTTPLGYSTTFYWRVRATDVASGVSGTYSTASTFVTPPNPDDQPD
jgi:hypothetical protein